MTQPDKLSVGGELADRVMEALMRAMEHPEGSAGFLLDTERALGATIVPYGASIPFPVSVDDWVPIPVISILDGEARIVGIMAKVERRGAFHRLLDGIRRAGLTPVIVTPIGDIMPGLMRRWKWKCTMRMIDGEPCEEWRPPVPTPGS